MENYKEYRNKLFEAFMDAEHPQEEVEYEEVEVEPVFLISEYEELTEENTAVIIEDDELSEELLNELEDNEKYANFNGHQVVVDKNSGVVKSGEFKGKRVNLVRDRRRAIKKAYKKSDKRYDNKAKNYGYSENDVKNSRKNVIRARHEDERASEERRQAHWDYRNNGASKSDYIKASDRALQASTDLDDAEDSYASKKSWRKTDEANKRKSIRKRLRTNKI